MLKHILIVLILVTGVHLANSQKLQNRKAETKTGLNYWEFLPNGYETSNKSPLIIFLHGRGERGDGSVEQLQKVLTWGPPKLIRNGEFNDLPFLVLSPQLNKPYDRWEPEIVDEFLNYAIKTYQVDLSRIYITGLSMGGNGVWNYAYSNYNSPNKLAAIVPIAAWGNPSKVCRLVERNISVWAFHGTEDLTVPYIQGKRLIDSLKNCSGVNSIDHQFTSFEKTGHNSWKTAYRMNNEVNVFDWMLKHKLAPEKVKALKTYIDRQSKDIGSTRLTSLGLLPASLKESSGLAMDKDGFLWSHNDSGNGPYLIKIDTTTKIHSYRKVTYASNMDWEDLAIDDENNLYIGDIGNNNNIRKNLFIYKVSLNDTTSERIPAERIQFYYEDQKSFPPKPANMKYDAEAMIYQNDFIYIFTKNRSEPFDGYTKIYRVPSIPGEYKAELIDSLKLGDDNMMENWVTSADISDDGEHLFLLSHSSIWVISCFKDKRFSEGHIQKVDLGHFSQKEAISTQNGSIYITDELFQNILGGNLYKLDLSEEILQKCSGD